MKDNVCACALGSKKKGHQEELERDCSVVRCTGCSSRGPRFDSQHPHDGSQPSVTLVPGDLMPSSGIQGTTCTWYPEIHKGKTTTRKIINNAKHTQQERGIGGLDNIRM